MLFGAANVNLWEYVPSANAYREHLYAMVDGKTVWPSINGPIPAAWPTLPAGKVGFYTIYPNPTQLLAGDLDAQLKAFIGSAPEQGGVLTAYAEADASYGEGGQFAAVGLTQATLCRVHAHLQALCKGTRVKYGAVFCGVGPESVAFAIPGLDFYALDWYDTWSRRCSRRSPSGRPMSARCSRTRCLPSPRPTPRRGAPPVLVHGGVRVAEELPAGAPGWVLGYWSYWHAGGPLSGPWVPDDTATIAALTSIGTDAQT